MVQLTKSYLYVVISNIPNLSGDDCQSKQLPVHQLILLHSLPSQYPGEAELTFPPFTCLEANGEPRLERTSDGEVVVFPLKVRRERGCLVAGSTVEPISEHGMVYRAWQPPGRHCCRPHLKISSSSVVKLVSEPGMV